MMEYSDVKPGVWIPVSELHPSYGRDRYVLGYSPRSYVKIETHTVYNNNYKGSCFSRGWNKGEQYEITHWMRLPEPPEKP
jgi:hypothetical protein